MMGRTCRRARLPLLAVLFGAALAACDDGDDRSAAPGDGVAAEAASPRADSGAALALAGEPPPAADAYFTEAAGQPWSQAEAYLGLLTFEEANDPESVDAIELCLGCDHSERVRIQPVRGVEHLGPKNVSGARRIVARVTISADNDEMNTRRLRSLGLAKDNKTRTSYLLVRGNGSAVFMYDRGGRIAFSQDSWKFTASTDGKKPGLAAHWVPFHESLNPKAASQDTSIVNHNSSIWLSCAEGCCNAQTPV